MLNAYNLKCLPEMGVNVGSLGCVMLDLEPVDLTDTIPEEWGYTSADPRLKHVTGIQHEAHLTLLYGLLSNANTIRSAVDEVLDGWTPQAVTTDQLDIFPSPIEGEDYSCIVARQAGPDRNLRDAHARLSLLPHINTFAEYKAHVTLAYVKAEHTEDAVRALRRRFGARDIHCPITLQPIGLNYGRKES